MAGARNNPAEPTGTVHSGVYLHVHVHVYGSDEQISTNYRIKDAVDASGVCSRHSRNYQPWTLGGVWMFYSVRTGGRNAMGSRCRGAETSHGASVEPCAANQLQSLPHPHKEPLMWVRPLNVTTGSHKATQGFDVTPEKPKGRILLIPVTDVQNTLYCVRVLVCDKSCQ